jgi:hypothetical protein
MYDAPKDSKHLVVCFEPLFEFQVFVPERMSKEVKSNTTGAALEKPVPAAVSMKYTSRGVQERRGWRKANMAYACACDAVSVLMPPTTMQKHPSNIMQRLSSGIVRRKRAPEYSM